MHARVIFRISSLTESKGRRTHGTRYNTEVHAKVAKLADAPDLGSGGAIRGGSSPPFRTIFSPNIEPRTPALSIGLAPIPRTSPRNQHDRIEPSAAQRTSQRLQFAAQ